MHVCVCEYLCVMWKTFRELRSLSDVELEEFLTSYKIFANDDCNDLRDYENGIEMVGFDDNGMMNAYYRTLHKLCCLGSVEKMYIPPTMDPAQSVHDNQILYEQSLMRTLGVGPGDTVLEIGCGAGRIAAHVASSTGAAVRGINIDPTQVARGNIHARERGIDAEFYTGDMNERLRFEDTTFDAVYGVQPFTYARNMAHVVSEIYRVLKPGGRLVMLDCVLLDAFNGNDPTHRKRLRETRELIGLGGFWHHKYWSRAIIDSGFTLVHSKNVSVDGEQHMLIARENRYFRLIQAAVRVLATFRVLPQHMNVIMERFNKHGRTFIDMDKDHLITTSWEFAAVKPS